MKQYSYGEYVFDHGWVDVCRCVGIVYYFKLLGAVPFSSVTGVRLLGDVHVAVELLDTLAVELDGEGLSSLYINFISLVCDVLMM